MKLLRYNSYQNCEQNIIGENAVGIEIQLNTVLNNNQFSTANLRLRQMAAARSRAPRGRSAGATLLRRKLGLGGL